MNPKMTPLAVGALIDLEANEEFIQGLLQIVRGGCSAEELVNECE